MGLLLIIQLRLLVSLRTFFKDNQELRHLYCISPNSDDYETEWGVASCKKDGKLFVFHGFDKYKFNQQNKISFLKVEIRKWKSSH